MFILVARIGVIYLKEKFLSKGKVYLVGEKECSSSGLLLLVNISSEELLDELSILDVFDKGDFIGRGFLMKDVGVSKD